MILSPAYELQEPAVPTASARRSAAQWLLIPLVVLMLALLFLIFLRAGEHLLTALLAYLNCVIGSVAIIHFLKHQSLSSIIPLFYLPYVVMAGSFSSIYFALFSPNVARHGIMGGSYPVLGGGVRYQAVLMLHLVCYLLVIWLLIRRPSTRPPVVATDSAIRLAKLTLWGGVIFMGANAVTKPFNVPFAIAYIAEGIYLYMHSLFFATGALIDHVRWRVRIAGMFFLVVLAVFYTIGNARSMAMFPVIFLFCGLLFAAKVPQKWKASLVLAAAVLLPIYLVVGNVTRAMTGTIGFTNLGARLEALARWREYLQAGSVLDRTLSRTFFHGGHSIITMSPEHVPYLDFSLGRYVGELVTRILIPGVIYYHPYYATTTLLLAYDIRISETTSTEISFPGSMWMIGGVVPLIVGSMVLGLFHSWVARAVAKANARSPLKALFYLTMLSTAIFYAPGFDFINQTKKTLYHFLAAIILYHLVVKRLIGPREGVLDSEPVPAGIGGAEALPAGG